MLERQIFQDILDVLKIILEGQKAINERLDKLEQYQTDIKTNQSVLSNGQNSIVANQQQIADKLLCIEANNMSKPEMMAQSKLLMECKVTIKKVETSICRMTGEVKDEIAAMLPLRTIEVVQEVEGKLLTPEFAQAMKTYLHKVKGASEDVSRVIRGLLTDDLLEKYNWELFLFDNILRDVFQKQGASDFEKRTQPPQKNDTAHLKKMGGIIADVMQCQLLLR
ncbi:uncharacterized protein LOC124420938 [Lucilia cuprina]|uniref:uncharacterized protein LOC124420938 n=1 Tax=Lucilia cuprina TaxID=7375 RepID=UPI001F060C19|nr:uncharacterized protein LOC124420938 [Lucilia cuprina]